MGRAARLPMLAAALALASGCAGGDADRAPQPAGGERPAGRSAELVDTLRRGGHILVFRHAATDSSMDTTEDLTDCSRQRNLSVDGREQAQAIGRAIEALAIPVGRVLASPFCRTRDTARLAFGRARLTRALLSDEFFASPAAARRKGLRRLLAVRPRPGTNTVLATHGTAILSATGVEADEGDALVVRPRPGRGSPRVVTTISAAEWGSLRPSD